MACCRLALCLALASLHAFAANVEELSQATFQKRTESSDIILVKFFAPWCGHCKQMAPAYEEAAGRLAKHSPPIPLAEVDGTKEPQLAQDQGIRGYPTLKIFRKGASTEYGGPRDADGIVKYMLEQVGSKAAASSLSGGSSGSVQESPLLMAKLCRDQRCDDDKFPILDYDENENKCICSAHPCWDDNGKTHACDQKGEFPHLTFSFTQDRTLECGCSKDGAAHYTSTYIAKVKCPGEHCESEAHPLLDFSPKENKCLCKAHPCHDMDGVRHECSDSKFPILVYREEMKNGVLDKICECKTISKKDEL